MDSLNELAVTGGTPAFPEKLFVNRPNLGDREEFHRRVEEIGPAGHMSPFTHPEAIFDLVRTHLERAGRERVEPGQC